MNGRLSLKARALQLLAQREHSRLELRRKLLPHARAACAADDSANPGGQPETGSATDSDTDSSQDVGPCLDKLLDWLQAHRYLSEERFVESRLHARASRFGARRIAHELAQHGLSLDAGAVSQLQTTEFERAQAVWARKFKAPAADAAERMRQMRFLAGRGFAPEVIRRIVTRGADPKD